MKFDNLIIMIMFLLTVFISGILGSIVYFSIQTLDAGLHEVNFDLPGATNSTIGNYNVTTFQETLEITIYPILEIFNALPFLSYFMIFGFIIALAMTAYMSSKNSIFFVLHILFTLFLTYFAIILKNAYANLLENPFMNTILIEFGVYNMMMLYLPQVFFMTSLVFGAISFVNVIKPSTSSNPQGLNYGGDY